tara:strand:+ start:356 stop:541 length:186 start_codon:yes stop_codon:yes gene_type:complete
MEKPVSNNDLVKLRTAKLISDQEIAIVAGDVIVAENVVTKARRILEVGTLMLESNRRILRD